MRMTESRTSLLAAPKGRLLVLALAASVSAIASAQEARSDLVPGDHASEVEAITAPPPRILVVLKQEPAAPLPRPGSTARPYAGRTPYSATKRSRRMAERIAKEYQLRQVDAWPIELLGVHCVVYELPVDARVEPLLESLVRDSRVEVAQRLNRFRVLGRPLPKEVPEDDPYLHLQYGIQSMQVREAHRWARGDGVKIAVVDTGLDASHPDLAGRVATVEDFVGSEEPRPGGEVHGTAVAGVIASAAGNGVGIVGVAPEARILSLRACWDEARPGGPSVCNSFTLAKAIAFAVDSGARVLNLSLTGPSDPLLERLVLAALERGMVVVAAEEQQHDGGPQTAVGFPTSVPGVFRVWAATAEVSSPVSLHQAEDLAFFAPGSEILTTLPGASFGFMSGSSFAAAHVSGVVALVLELRPKIDAAALHDALRAASRVSPQPGDFSAIIVNACSALAEVESRVDCPIRIES